jgi:hypothetical protein
MLRDSLSIDEERPGTLELRNSLKKIRFIGQMKMISKPTVE